MKLPMSWLKEYVDIGDISASELADKLLNIGFEVEDICYLGKDIENVLTAKITSIEKHPDADKLQICGVDFGFEQSTIITAATNVFVGAIVPVARDNSYLPTGKHIKTSKLRGMVSYGMFCSGSELCIDDSVIEGAEADGILILPPDTPVGEDIKKTLGLDEYILDISITANRPDCQSVLGISREIAALLNTPLKYPSIEYHAHETTLECFGAEIQNKNCQAYTGTVIDDVKIMPSPKWMHDRLRYVGVRAINNIVDITNYVLMEIGQPLHAFDLNCVDDKVIIRSARENEEITALNGIKYKLTPDIMVIADVKKPLAIAGIMGGEYSGINPDTKAVFLEAAKFARGNVRASSRKLGLRSDSSARYEKGVDWFNLEFGRARALHLFEELGCGQITDKHISVGDEPPKNKHIKTDVKAINDLLGIEISPENILDILRRLEIQCAYDEGKINCVVPSFREDIDNYTDLAEEIIRYYGYDKLKSTFIVNAHPTVGGKTADQKYIDIIKDYMVACGAMEAMTFSFVSERQYNLLDIPMGDCRRNFIKIKNPLGEEYSIMRTQLVGSMLECIARNAGFKNTDYRLFEIARVYIPGQLPLTQLPEENYTLSIAFVGAKEDFYCLKSAVKQVLRKLGADDAVYERSSENFLHPGISADVIFRGDKLGYLGKIHPETAAKFSVPENVYLSEINLQALFNVKKPVVSFRPLPKFPVVDRDIAVIVNEDVAVGDMIAEIYKAIGHICDDVKLFDVYRGAQIAADKKSVAFSLKLRSDDHTLVDEEIQKVMAKVIKCLQTKFDAQLR